MLKAFLDILKYFDARLKLTKPIILKIATDTHFEMSDSSWSAHSSEIIRYKSMHSEMSIFISVC